MPRGPSVREAVNEGEVKQALKQATAGYGNSQPFCDRLGLAREYVQGMVHGNRRVSVRVAEALGYELRWIKRTAPAAAAAPTAKEEGEQQRDE